MLLKTKKEFIGNIKTHTFNTLMRWFKFCKDDADLEKKTRKLLKMMPESKDWTASDLDSHVLTYKSYVKAEMDDKRNYTVQGKFPPNHACLLLIVSFSA